MLYIANSVARIFGLCLALTGILVVVFAIEKFTYLLEVTFKYQVSLRGFLLLYLSILPDLADFFVPITIVIAVYVIVLRMRESREFLILASAGIGYRYIVFIALGAALSAATFSAVLSGFVKPASNLSFRHQYDAAITAALSKGLPGGRFYVEGDKVMFVAPAAAGFSKLMRTFEFEGERLDRLTLSNCADVRAIAGKVVSDLCDARIYLFDSAPRENPGESKALEKCRFCTSPGRELDIALVDAARSTIVFDMKSLFGVSIEPGAKDLNLFELLRLEGGRFASITNARTAVGYFFLAFACVLAVAAALGAVALTAPSTHAVALAGAIGIVAATIVLARSNVLVVGPVDSPVFLAMLLTGTGLGSLATTCAVAILVHERLILPVAVQA